MNFEQPPMPQQEKEKEEPKVEKSEAEQNAEKCGAFLDDWHEKFRNNENMPDEELLRYAREAQKLWHQEFNDDEQYYEARKQLDSENEKSPYVTEEKLKLFEVLGNTTRGKLWADKGFIEHKLLSGEKSEDNKEGEIETYEEMEQAKKAAGVTDRYEALKKNLYEADDDDVLKENLSKEIELERQVITKRAEESIREDFKYGYVKYYEIVPVKDDIYGVVLPGLKSKTGNFYIGYNVRFFESEDKAKEAIKEYK